MTETKPLASGAWVPQACTLPAAEQPLRLTEFDDLFVSAVRAVQRPDPLRVRLTLRPEPQVAARAADLMTRETGCCSFFSFSLTATGDRLILDVTVPTGQHAVLDALVVRAGLGGGS
ncbi:hypothetical protein [Micromonospora radicis]|uniref:Arsenate reductase n=1 Tax=Micromonospora radicis TaxID=1894971 RepID=A0A418MYU8_9ACTN|nr:hypothetical protein [Micromonospora radicis]RIV40358.1 hypothetical protein D2L64_05865 [Micromonospora radicis]